MTTPTMGVVGARQGTLRAVVADDDPDICETVVWQLETIGCQVHSAPDGRQALDLIVEHEPDVVIIDLVLPELRGLEVLRAARTVPTDPIVIVISGRSDETDRIVALEMGADDFVVKPFSPRELLARVNACQRRRGATEPSGSSATMTFDELTIDTERREVRVSGRRVVPTRREYELLVFLASQPGRVFDKAELIAGVWGSEPGWLSDATVTEHVRRLRHKIEADPSDPRRIRTLRGHGYLFSDH